MVYEHETKSEQFWGLSWQDVGKGTIPDSSQIAENERSDGQENTEKETFARTPSSNVLGIIYTESRGRLLSFRIQEQRLVVL